MPPLEVGISGLVRLSPGAAIDERSVVRVSLLDVTFTDRAATVVAEQRISAREIEAGRGSVRFELGAILDSRRRYSVSAHADLDGDGVVSAGDQISTESYPVGTFGYPQIVEVILRPC